MRGRAQRRAVRHGMHMWNVRSNRKMHSYGDAAFEGVQQNRGRGVLRRKSTSSQKSASGFAVSNPMKCRCHRDLIQEKSRFRSHAKLASLQTCADVFGGSSGKCYLKIVNQGGAIHSDARNETTAHQLVDDGTQSD